MHTYIYIHIHIYIQTYVYTYKLYVYMYILTSTHTYMHVYMHTCLYVKQVGHSGSLVLSVDIVIGLLFADLQLSAEASIFSFFWAYLKDRGT